MVLSIAKQSSFWDCKFRLLGPGGIFVGKRCSFKSVRITVDKDSKVSIGDSVIINAYKLSPTIINAFEGSEIMIGGRCLFSNGIELHTSDDHSILFNGKRYNNAGNIIIGNHTWVGLRAIILKNVLISQNTVIAAGSIVASSYTEEDILIAGIPARKIKESISWDIERL